MKDKLATSFWFLALRLLVLSLLRLPATSCATDLAPASGALTISRTKGAAASTVTLTNAGDQVWIIQSSADMGHWTELATWKVHNGSFGQAFSDEASPSRFFRAVYDSTRQNVLSMTATALLLPQSPFNYAAPILPLPFHVQPILGQDDTPANNPVTDPAATLGRM